MHVAITPDQWLNRFRFGVKRVAASSKDIQRTLMVLPPGPIATPELRRSFGVIANGVTVALDGERTLRAAAGRLAGTGLLPSATTEPLGVLDRMFDQWNQMRGYVEAIRDTGVVPGRESSWFWSELPRLASDAEAAANAILDALTGARAVA
ncbi:MAG: hypothetical protein KDC46_06210 [Thermoleophilia bacterium]|nr:hypothetical protein [Thermoleophilia bacterium]